MDGDTEIAACGEDEAVQTDQLGSEAEAETGLLEPLEDFPFHPQHEHKYEDTGEDLEDFEDEDIEDMPLCNVEVSVELQVEEDEEVAVGVESVEGDDGSVSDGGGGGVLGVPLDGEEYENDEDGTSLRMKPEDDPDEDCVVQCHSSDNDGCGGGGDGAGGSDEEGYSDEDEDEDGPRGEEDIDNIDMWVGHHMEMGSSDEDDDEVEDGDPVADAAIFSRSQSQSQSRSESERPRKRRRRRIGEVPDEPYAPSESSDSGSGGGGGEDSDSDYEYYSDVEKAHLRRKKALGLNLDLCRRIYVPLFLPCAESLPPRGRYSSSPWVMLERLAPSELSCRGIPIPQAHPHRCTQCWEKFSRDTDLKAHVKEMHPDTDPGTQSQSSPAPVYECPLSFCRSRWKDKGKLHRHFWINHPEETRLIPQRKVQSWPCPQPQCGEVVGGKHHLLKHMWSVHPQEAKEWEKQTIFKSGVNAKGEVWKSRLPVDCPHCGVTLANIRTLRKHLRARHPNAPNQGVYPAKVKGLRLSKMPVDCPQCGKTFANRRNLRDHLKNVHLNPNPTIENFQHKSNENGNASTNLIDIENPKSAGEVDVVMSGRSKESAAANTRNLREHLRARHPSAPDAIANTNGQNVSFNAGANVNVLDLEGLINGKERSLSGPGMPVRCPHCGKRYSNIRDLREHARERHPNAPNQFYVPMKVKGLRLAKMPVDCPQCGKTFANRRNLRDHLKNVHNPNSKKSRLKSNENPMEKGVTVVISKRSKKSAAAKTWSSRQPVDCPHCLKTISNIRHLRKHIMRLHPNAADTSVSTTNGNDTEKTVMATSAKTQSERQPNRHVTDDEDENEDEDAEQPNSNTKTANSNPKLNKPKSRSAPTPKVKDEVVISKKAKKSAAAKTWPSRQPVDCPHCLKTMTVRHLRNHIQRRHPNAADTSTNRNSNGNDTEPRPQSKPYPYATDEEDGHPSPSKSIPNTKSAVSKRKLNKPNSLSRSAAAAPKKINTDTEAVNLPTRPPWRCPISICKRLLRNKILLTTHMESKHPDTDVIPQDRGIGSSREKPDKEFQCRNCKKESFDRHSKLVAHMKTCAQRERPRPATSRGRLRSRQRPTRTRTRIMAVGSEKRESQKNQRRRNSSSKDKDKDSKFRCYFCSSGVGTLEDLVQHTALHTGECLLSCPQCKARFRHEFLFNVHTQVCLNLNCQ